MRTWLIVPALALACGPVVSTDDSASSSSGPDSTGGDDAPMGSGIPQPTTDPSDPSDPPNPTNPTSPVTTSTSTTSDASTSSDDGATFIVDPTEGGCGGDDGGLLFRCSVWDQDCCPGEKCMPWANDGGAMWNASRCSPVDPAPRQLGEPCTVEGSAVSGVDNCDVGLMCWNVDPLTNEGECIALCPPPQEQPVCPDFVFTSCVIANEGTLPLCLPTCDPLLQDCEQGQVCAPSGESPDNGFFACMPAGAEMLGPGVGCEFPTSCPVGMTCVPPVLAPDCDIDPCCVPYCDMTIQDDPTCTDGTECVPYYAPQAAGPGYEDVGICITV